MHVSGSCTLWFYGGSDNVPPSSHFLKYIYICNHDIALFKEHAHI